MPTSNPRVNVTLSPTLDELVSRFAAAQRTSKSNVLRELLEASAPSLGRAVALMEAAQRAKPEMLRGMANAMSQAQARIEGIVEGALYSIEAQPDLVVQAEEVRPRRPRRAAAGANRAKNPPASNRGVKSGEKRGKRGGKGASS